MQYGVGWMVRRLRAWMSRSPASLAAAALLTVFLLLMLLVGWLHLGSRIGACPTTAKIDISAAAARRRAFQSWFQSQASSLHLQLHPLDVPATVISLPKAQARRARLTADLRRLAPPETTPPPLAVFHPVPLERDPLALALADQAQQPSLFHGPVEASVMLSHLRAVAQALREHPTAPYVLVMEDDIGLAPAALWPAPLSALLQQVSARYPQWEFLNLACLSAARWCPQPLRGAGSPPGAAQPSWSELQLQSFTFLSAEYLGPETIHWYQRLIWRRPQVRCVPLEWSAVAYALRATERLRGLFRCLDASLLQTEEGRVPASFDKATGELQRCLRQYQQAADDGGALAAEDAGGDEKGSNERSRANRYGHAAGPTGAVSDWVPANCVAASFSAAHLLTEYSDWILPKIFGPRALITSMPLFSLRNEGVDELKVHQERTDTHIGKAVLTEDLWLSSSGQRWRIRQ